MVYWITGRSNAGKTTFSRKLKKNIDNQFGYPKSILIDGDDLRAKFECGFDDDGRRRNLLNAVAIAELVKYQGFIPICAFVSPTVALRNMVRAYFNDFTLIYIPGGELWENTTYEEPDVDEFPHSPEEIISIVNTYGLNQ